MSHKIITHWDGVLHILRNPFGFTEDIVRQARLDAADRLEALERENMTLRLHPSKDAYNSLSVLHGEMFMLARSCLAAAWNVLEVARDRLTAEEIDESEFRLKALDSRVYGVQPRRPRCTSIDLS